MQNAVTFHTTNSPRAIEIVRGLRRSGRSPQNSGAISLIDDGRWVTVGRDAGRYYSSDGLELRRGADLADSYELQASFTDAMARMGREKTVAPAPSRRRHDGISTEMPMTAEAETFTPIPHLCRWCSTQLEEIVTEPGHIRCPNPKCQAQTYEGGFAEAQA